MLLELKVSNFAIIENLQIEFSKGLNILSGETGAGKSVLLKSLSLLMGMKGSTEQIRSGQTQASIQGSFDLTSRPDLRARLLELGIEVDENILVVRRVLSQDKSKVYLNGNLSTLQTLRDIVSPLIDLAGAHAPLIEMTGQHDNRNLLSKSYHLDLLDQYTGVWDQRHSYTALFQEWSELKQEIENFQRESQQKAQRLDFLKFQRDEIARLDLSPGEDVEIENDLKRLKNASRLTDFVDQAESALYSDDDSAFSRVKAILKRGAELMQWDPSLAGKLESLAQAQTVIEDFVYDLRQSFSSLESDPQRLEKLQERLSDLRKLQKKYGSSVDEILQALIKIESEISALENSETHLAQMQSDLEAKEKELWKRARDMHKRRSEGAKLLANSVNSELSDLNMKGVQFHVDIQLRDSLTATGISDVEFQSQTSPKDPPRALSKFASGGELSRILLSLKRVVGSSKWPRTYLFDEVDTGVSGPTAEKVGKKLKSIAKGQQVICVTHLPQVAAFGDQHFFIQKSPKKGAAAMEVKELLKTERVEEIARLISGEKITKTSLAHAQELLKSAAL
jgi:DNA repair protein RecN (Recombination protein N)